MKRQLTVEQLLAEREHFYLADVRSPKEYAEAHIPGAANIPLLENEERALVGITYKDEGTDRAKQVGLSLVAPRLPQMIEKIRRQAKGKKVVIYCWRGGTRSRSICAIMEALNYPVWQLQGGYKAFRRYIHSYLSQATVTMPVFVLNGLTGVGKTHIIKILQQQGYPALDLEGMANHRGSAFGAVGLGQARSQKDFEALLALFLLEHHAASYLVIEGEGKRIGSATLPDFLFQAMEEGQHLLLEADVAVRVGRIVEEYQGRADHLGDLAEAVKTLSRKLGKAKSEELASLIRQGELETVVKTLCTDYYDHYYSDSRQGREKYLAVVSVNELNKGAAEILTIINDYLAAQPGFVGREE
ncbi:MAG TPA: tRNA 2-selenouridine(34) synthase MnmH [Oscillospiraceae bacterium]|nr:tRNA 2-selenouridine(34) synthase MnmH [Oscillospiraceae bacterium]